MKKETKLSVFAELIANSCGLCYCCYTPSLKLLSSNQAVSELEGMTLLLASVGEEMLEYSKNGHYPYFLDSFLHILWVVDFEWEEDTLKKLHVLGPTMTNKNSYEELRRKLDQRNLSVSVKHAVLDRLANLPIIASNLLYEYTIMLHYCLTGEHISSADFVYAPSEEENTEESMPKEFTNEHIGIWSAEQKLVSMFREGNPNWRQAMADSSKLSYGVKHKAKSALDQAKNNYITLLTLVSRAAIEGGLSPSISYDLNDYYMQQMENAERLNELSALQNTMLDDYMERVRQAKADNGISKTIQNCCDYISVHISDRLSTKDLADLTGYTEYYFSRKFKQEMGCGIREYITKEKIERAKILLSSTNMSILEISIELSFSSRSYFSDTFQKICGMSPAEYRRQTLKV